MQEDSLKQNGPKKDMQGFRRLTYDSPDRFLSYWHQINEICSLMPKEILEIGIGNGFVSKYIKDRGLNVTTMDINENLCPDICASVLDIPLEDDSFDVVACCEVLEHLPYTDLPKALAQIKKVTRRYAIISLPDARKFFTFRIGVDRGKIFQRYFDVWRIARIDEHHQWEINQPGYANKRISSDIENAGFRIIKNFRTYRGLPHRYFVLEKSPAQ